MPVITASIDLFGFGHASMSPLSGRGSVLHQPLQASTMRSRAGGTQRLGHIAQVEQ